MTDFKNPGVDAAAEYFAAQYGEDEPEFLYPFFIADVLHAAMKSTGLGLDELIEAARRTVAGDIEVASFAHEVKPDTPLGFAPMRDSLVHVPVDLQDTEWGARTIIRQHHEWRVPGPVSRYTCCAFCAEQLDTTPVWFALVVHYSRLD